MSIKRSLLAITVLALVATAFQNCTQAVNQGSESSRTQNNGTGYGGKIFVVRLPTGVCADGSDIVTRIVTIDEKTGLKDRDACADIPGIQVSLDAGDVYKSMQISASPNPYDVLVVAGAIFDLENSNARTTRFCHGSMPSQYGLRKSDVVVREINRSSTVYFESGVFDSTDSLIPNSTHYSVSYESTVTTNGNDEYYNGTYGQSDSIQLLIAEAVSGVFEGQVNISGENLTQSGMTCYKANQNGSQGASQ